ncbi:MAG: orotidine-5'-phosphate decarboxylase [Phycisphaerales bacterium]|nr:orotidine-5'-phosphate decarboxylase [Phycisphaerales bacterium]
MLHFADRLLEAIRRKQTPICVGLDPVYERLPVALRGDASATADVEAKVEALEKFSRGVIEAVQEHVAVIKPQSACFERYGWRGVWALESVIHVARQAGLMVILDGKRGDIGISSEHYAAGLLGENVNTGSDALTVNAYLGADGLQPFIKNAAAHGKGLFALVRTSNPGGDALQAMKLQDGRSVAEAVGQIVSQAGESVCGQSGYSLLGAVVGATKASEAAQLRRLMPRQWFSCARLWRPRWYG